MVITASQGGEGKNSKAKRATRTKRKPVLKVAAGDSRDACGRSKRMIIVRTSWTYIAQCWTAPGKKGLLLMVDLESRRLFSARPCFPVRVCQG